METIIYNSREEAADFIVGRLCALLEEKPDALICIDAGKDSLPVFESMKKAQDEGRLDLESAEFIGMWEWERIPPNNAASHANFLYSNLFFPLNVEPMNIHMFDSLGKSGECMVVKEIIDQHGGIDFLISGLGPNGRLGLNEPGSDLASSVRIVEVTEETRTGYFGDEVPSYMRAMTIGLHEIFSSGQIYLPVFGEDMAVAVKTLSETASSSDFPASFMKAPT